MEISKCCQSPLISDKKAVSSDEMHICSKCLRHCVSEELKPIPLEFYCKLFKTIEDEPTSNTGKLPAESH